MFTSYVLEFLHLATYVMLCMLARCTLRFPSTNVKITFQVLHGSATDNMPVTSSAALSSPSPAKPLQPLHISIPKPSESVSVFASPCPSPTGTIRLALMACLKSEVFFRAANFIYFDMLRHFQLFCFVINALLIVLTLTMKTITRYQIFECTW